MATSLARREGMTDDELAAMLGEHETRSIGYYESEVASQQADAIARYFRRPYGDERDGRSQVVDSTVATTVDNALAAVLKPFVSSDETVVFQPRSAEDEEQAEQATEYVNYVLHNDNDGFTVLHDWFKDALLCKLGVVKVYWEDKTRDKVERLERVDAISLQMLDPEEIVDGPYGPDEDGLYSVDVVRRYEDGCIKVENIPPEEHRISPLARPNRVPPYEAHIRNMPRSELVEMGMDPEVVDTLAATSQTVTEDARAQERRSDQDWGSTQTTQPGDKSREMVQVNDEYVLVDYDGDGISELRHIIRSGTVILFNEEVEEGPFARLCPVPMPHTIYGMSLADLVIDEQRIATVLWRQTLDNLYLANNPRIIIPESSERSDGSTMDSIAVIAPGAPILAGDGAEIKPFAVPFIADKSYPMLAYVEQQAEARTGIQKQGQGLDPDSLNQSKQITATQSAQMEEAQNNRAELIARIFAETGVKQLFRLMLRLLVAHQPRSRMIRLRNKWVEMDPRQWNADMDLSISVGLGIGNKAAQIAVADGIIGTMAMALQHPGAKSLFGIEEMYNAIKRKFTAAGIKNTNEFVKEPQRDPEGNVIEPETPPSPEQQKVQADMMAKQAELQMKQAEGEQKLQLAREEAAAKIQLEREKAQAEMLMNQQRMEAELELERQRMHLQHEADMRAASVKEQLSARDSDRKDRETESKIKRNRSGGDLSK